jgi:hypothetical protein
VLLLTIRNYRKWLAMAKRTNNEDIARMLESLDSELQAFHDFDKRVEETMESKLFELKALSYINLLLVAVLLAIAFGVVLRALGL